MARPVCSLLQRVSARFATPRSRSRMAGLLAGMIALGSLPIGMSSAFAQGDYPNRPIKIVVPIPPGPILDVVPRIIADKLSARWGQPVIVENRPGGAQNLATEAVARAKPDGYTLLVTPPGPLTVNQYVFPRLTFDPGTLTPVSILVTPCLRTARIDQAMAAC